MKRLFFVIFIISILSCTRDVLINESSIFEITEIEDEYMIIVPIENEIEKYFAIVEKYGYEGNGYSWEYVISKLLERLDPDLLEELYFDSEAGTFVAYAPTKEVCNRFTKLLLPIFNDFERLEYYMQQMDSAEADD